MPAISDQTGKSVNAPKPKKRVVGKVKAKATPDQQDRNRNVQPGAKVRARVRQPASKDTYRSPREQELLSEAHSVRIQANRQKREAGTSPAGDRPQNRAREMDRAPVRRVMVVDPNTGREISTLRTPAPPRGSQQRGTSPSGDRPQGRAKEMRQAPTVKVRAKGNGAGGPLLGVVQFPAGLAAKYADAVTGGDINPTGMNIAGTIVKDAAELAVTTPSSVAKIASTAVHDPKKLPGMLAEPYIDLAKDPKKAISEHPVSTALMLQPAVRVPGRVVGRVARQAGKQTLERPDATLPGTALREKRTGSRDALVRAHQAREDRKNPAPKMTQADVQRRADEFYDFAKQHRTRVREAAERQAKQRGLAGEARDEHISGALGGAQTWIDRKFGEEFGAVHQISPQGHIVQPKNATAGTIHETRAAAERVADRLNGKTTTVRRGAGGNPVMTARRNTPRELQFTVHEVGADGSGGYVVLPKIATETLHKHSKVGSAGAPGSKLMRVAGKTFRTAVLPLSMKWLSGQAIEAGLRSSIAHAGPADLVRFNRIVHAMNQHRPGSGDELMMRVANGGQFGLTGTAREFAEGKTTLAEEFAGTAFEDVAHGLTKAGATKPAQTVRKGWQAYTNVVMGAVNGAIETTARKAMAGQAIRQGGLMEQRINGLSGNAIDDAARGLRGTESQVELGRAVDRMYGQYQKFSWQKRETLLHTTPFYPWYRSMVTFLTKVLPVDHPVTTALLADMSLATEEWRKAHGLSLRQGGHKPGFLLGGYPVGDTGRVVRYGRYTPAAPGDVYGSLADLVTPQFGGVKEILKGRDYAGRDVKGNRALVAALSLLEAHVPGAGQLDRVTGLGGHYIRETGEPTVIDGKRILPAIRREVDPLVSTKAPAAKNTTTRRTKGAYRGAYGSGYDTGAYGSGYSAPGYK